MGLKLEKGLQHQTIAVNRIKSVFQDVPILKSNKSYSNPIIDLDSITLFNNIKRLNSDLPNSMRGKTEVKDYLNIDVKMETGTGKTYVYTKSIFELNKNFGFNKFVIIVPSIAIKLGTKNFITSEETRLHFNDQYDKEIDLYILDANKKKKNSKDLFPSSVREFVETTMFSKDRINVLLINMQLLTSRSVLGKEYSSSVEDFYNPCDAIKSTKPIVIVDEPHRLKKENKYYDFMKNAFNPQCIIRFGATFPKVKIGRNEEDDYHNLIYNLNSCDAFNNNLIKGIKINPLNAPDGNNLKVKILKFNNKDSVRLELIKERVKKTFELNVGESLKQIDSSFENIFITGIGKKLYLSNGQELDIGNEIYADVYSASYQATMIKNSLDLHFKTEKENFKRKDKIKTIALFFIDDISSYREQKDNPMPTYLKDIFEDLLKNKINEEIKNINENDADELLYKKYLEATLDDISDSHAGYFASDNNDAEYDDEIRKILTDKEETLSIYKADGTFNIFRFIFSKWTLKEGWDNPNVFTICKLRSSGSEISKLQEVGRGLRLPVNNNLIRVSNEQFYLNYIVDFTEKDFAMKLLNEINGDVYENSIITDEQIDKLAIKLGISSDDLFINLLTNKFIDRNKNIILENRDRLFSEFPDLETGLKSNKVIDMSNNKDNEVRIRKEKFEEIKELWQLLNKKYFISYQNISDEDIIKTILAILKDGVNDIVRLSSSQQTLITDTDGARLIQEEQIDYELDVGNMPYNEFLNKIYQNTNIPISLIHKALIEYNKIKKISDDFFNTATATNIINEINNWKYNTLQGKFKYTAMNVNSKKTSLTDSNGDPLEYITRGFVGIHSSDEKPSNSYLYDLCLYDSDLERRNITLSNDKVIVFGKIPKKSVRIPLLNGFSYSPDFMYIINNDNGVKEINLVIESKDYNTKDSIPMDQQYEIETAKLFFEQLKKDGFNVEYKLQLHNDQISKIIKNLNEG